MAPQQQQQIITLPNGQQQIVTLPGTQQPQQQMITLPGGQQQLVTLPASATAPGQPQQLVPVPSLPQQLMGIPGGANGQSQQPQAQQIITLPGGQQAIVRMAAPNQQVSVLFFKNSIFFTEHFQCSPIKIKDSCIHRSTGQRIRQRDKQNFSYSFESGG